MEKAVHFRVCHHCGHVNSKEMDVMMGKVQRCSGCNHSLAPFYYFDDRFTAVMSDTSLRGARHKGDYSPILGLTVYWESF